MVYIVHRALRWAGAASGLLWGVASRVSTHTGGSEEGRKQRARFLAVAALFVFVFLVFVFVSRFFGFRISPFRFPLAPLAIEASVSVTSY